MVDTLVSGASASRHVGSSPILGTEINRNASHERITIFCLTTTFFVNETLSHYTFGGCSVALRG